MDFPARGQRVKQARDWSLFALNHLRYDCCIARFQRAFCNRQDGRGTGYNAGGSPALSGDQPQQVLLGLV